MEKVVFKPAGKVDCLIQDAGMALSAKEQRQVSLFMY